MSAPIREVDRPSPGPAALPPPLSSREIPRWVWRQLTSMRTALMLLLLLGVAAVPGSLVPQDRVDPGAVARWKVVHPDLTPWLQRVGLFHVYGTPWFSAVYLLLTISLVGCILPRTRVYWRATLASPTSAPRNLSRIPGSTTVDLETDGHHAAQAARRLLRRQLFRTQVTSQHDIVTVSAQRGYLREAGNLVFHVSVLLVLVGFALGNLFGFRGGVIVVAGQTFSNTRQSYDDFAPGSLFDSDRLTPFVLKLDDFRADFLRSGPTAGQPRAFRADITYRRSPSSTATSAALEVNKPLDIGGTSVFLVGNGYAPVVTVRDAKGDVVYSGPTVFLPEDASYASVGVVKAPDAVPGLAFEGQFLPSYAISPAGSPYSAFPDALAPALSLRVYTGDLGLDSGRAQSVYVLDKRELKPVTDRRGRLRTFTVPLGETARLPDGIGSITFDGLRRWTKLQVSATPAEPLVLAAVILGLLGLLCSLMIRPRRLWLRLTPSDGGVLAEFAAIHQRRADDPKPDVESFLDKLRKEIS